MQQNHFILVHGACHGAWCWYKVKPRLEAAGHLVTAVDLSASGVNTRKMEELETFHDYILPLLEVMASIPADEKVILVGHSYGGLGISLAMDNYPEKVLVGVFVAAFMPDTRNPPNYVLQKMHEINPDHNYMDTQSIPYGSPEKPRMSMLFGPKFLSTKLYQLCSAEDIALGKMLVRPIPNLSREHYGCNFSDEGYGSVNRVYIVCCEDKGITESYQRWQIENAGGATEVKEIKDADHMPMWSKPQDLCQSLIEIALKYHV